MLGAAGAVAARRRTPPSRSLGGLAVAAIALLAVAALRLAGAQSGDLATRAGMDRILVAGSPGPAAISTSPGRSPGPTPSASSATARPTSPRWPPQGFSLHPW